MSNIDIPDDLLEDGKENRLVGQVGLSGNTKGYDEEVIVENGPEAPQTITCPVCEEHSWQDFIQEGIAGFTCSNCGSEIRYTRVEEIRSSGSNDDTPGQQTNLSDMV